MMMMMMMIFLKSKERKEKYPKERQQRQLVKERLVLKYFNVKNVHKFFLNKLYPSYDICSLLFLLSL